LKSFFHIHKTTKVSEGIREQINDPISVEEPLDIRIQFGPTEKRNTSNLAVTMRTPGNDEELAIGFLLSEGIINQIDDVLEVQEMPPSSTDELSLSRILVSLHPDLEFTSDQLARNFYTASSCGICGKNSMDQVCDTFEHIIYPESVSEKLVYSLKSKLDALPGAFRQTGSLHASVLLDSSGKLLAFREDVGRHNALDKLLGFCLESHWIPLSGKIVLLSGRISFELVQKCGRAGVPTIAAIGAPSSAAILLAEQLGICLIGFARADQFNVYTYSDRVQRE